MGTALRTTVYGPSLDSVTMVVRESDMASGDFSKVRELTPGVLVIHDEFDIADNADLIAATHEATVRQEQCVEQERNLAIWYYWNTMQLSNLAERGVIANPKPAPLSVEMLERGMRQLRLHPAYRMQSVISISEDGYTVVLDHNGGIDSMPPHNENDSWDA